MYLQFIAIGHFLITCIQIQLKIIVALNMQQNWYILGLIYKTILNDSALIFENVSSIRISDVVTIQRNLPLIVLRTVDRSRNQYRSEQRAQPVRNTRDGVFYCIGIALFRTEFFFLSRKRVMLS